MYPRIKRTGTAITAPHIFAIVCGGTPRWRSSFVMSLASRTARRVPLEPLGMCLKHIVPPSKQHRTVRRLFQKCKSRVPALCPFASNSRDSDIFGKRIQTRLIGDKIQWRRGWESNPRMKVLQTSPLPLGYRAETTSISKVAMGSSGESASNFGARAARKSRTGAGWMRKRHSVGRASKLA
jgi:hypothetical protein